MSILRNRKKLGTAGGFTLLETLLALSIAAMAAVFFGSFLIPKMELYYNYDRRSQAKAMCGEAYLKMEEILRYGYMYAYNPSKPEELLYFTREEGPAVHKERKDKWKELPACASWPSLSAEDLDIRSFGGMSLELDFGGTTAREVKVRIEAVRDDVVIYEEEATIGSLYGYDMSKGSIS